MRKAVLAEAEYAFRQKIQGYDHMIDPQLWKRYDEGAFDKIVQIQKWLQEQSIDCIAFDTSAMGEYKHLANVVMFRHADDAMLFKLTWL